MRKNILLIGALLFLLPSSLLAQETSLGKLYKWLDASKGLQIQLVYTIGEYKDQPASYYGYGNKFYFESELLKSWYDGVDLWVYVAQSGEVNLTTPEPADLVEINPLLNLNRINSKDYKITERADGEYILLKAIPYRSSDIEWIEVKISRDGLPLSLILKEKGVEENVVVKLRSLKQEAFKGMQQKDFYRFTKNKLSGIMVIDLR